MTANTLERTREFKLEVLSGSTYTGNCFSSDYQPEFLPSDIEPKELGMWNTKDERGVRWQHIAYLIVQGGNPILIIQHYELEPKNTNQSHWLQLEWDSYDLRQCNPIFAENKTEE